MNLLNVTNVSQVWYSERNTENAMSDLYFHEESDYSEENTAWAWTEKKLVVMRAIRKELNTFTLQLSIYYILEEQILIGAGADIARTKREK